MSLFSWSKNLVYESWVKRVPTSVVKAVVGTPIPCPAKTVLLQVWGSSNCVRISSHRPIDVASFLYGALACIHASPAYNCISFVAPVYFYLQSGHLCPNDAERSLKKQLWWKIKKQFFNAKELFLKMPISRHSKQSFLLPSRYQKSIASILPTFNNIKAAPYR